MNGPIATSPGRTANPVVPGDSLADVLERVLDKGIVVAGDIRVDLLDIELLTIRIRLLISSADKAEELGMAWWRNDPFFTGQQAVAEPGHEDVAPELGSTLERLVDGTERLAERVARLEAGNGHRAQEGG